MAVAEFSLVQLRIQLRKVAFGFIAFRIAQRVMFSITYIFFCEQDGISWYPAILFRQRSVSCQVLFCKDSVISLPFYSWYSFARVSCQEEESVSSGSSFSRLRVFLVTFFFGQCEYVLSRAFVLSDVCVSCQVLLFCLVMRFFFSVKGVCLIMLFFLVMFVFPVKMCVCLVMRLFSDKRVCVLSSSSFLSCHALLLFCQGSVSHDALLSCSLSCRALLSCPDECVLSRSSFLSGSPVKRWVSCHAVLPDVLSCCSFLMSCHAVLS
jgi:hypothetical protein